MGNINSFSQNINKTVENSLNTLAMTAAIQQSMTTADTFVTYDYTDKNGDTTKYTLPSYSAVVDRLKAVEESINSLTTGKGIVNLNDGSRRTVTLSTIPHTPNMITGLDDPSTFTIDSNWFFEELMFPGAKVNVDLTGQIEDTADRVRVTRIILDSTVEACQSIWMSDLASNNYDYASLKVILSNNAVPYYEDEETVELPLVSNTMVGTFQIVDDPEFIDGNVWYKLDSITYSTISTDGVIQGQNNILSVGDSLAYRESIFEITEIDQNHKKIHIKRICGVDTPGVYTVFTYYQNPFRSKVLGVRFGAHEYNIIYFKGVSEAHNLLADRWSNPVKFSSDELVLAGSYGLQNTTFAEYYNRYVVDWGAEMIAEAKEAKISAWYGTTPNAPVLNGDDFRVVQINTQINAAIDTTDVKNIAAEIESVKSQISSLKNTIAAQKTDLQSAVNTATYNSIQQQIATNTTDLNNLQTTYTTLVDSFQTIVRENSAVLAVPKYHIRGFFPIPEYKYRDESETIPEEIIGFDIAYRYIREDNTGVPLATYSYTNTDGTEISATYTDWNIIQSPIKTKVYDSDLGRYVWRSENVADGSEVNVNQIDIPISKGEKVEIKIRSISEAGYPMNPLRSVWSNAVVMEFPDTLATGNEIADLVTKINDDALTITINNILEAGGYSAHLSDTVPNTGSVTGTYYHHIASNIGYEDTRVVNEEGGVGQISMSLQEKIQSLEIVNDDSSVLIAKTMSDISVINSLLNSKIEQYETSISELQSGLAQTDASVNIHDIKFDTILDTDGNLFTPKVNFRLKSANSVDGSIIGSIGIINQSNSAARDELYVFGADSNKTGTLHVTNILLHTDGTTSASQTNSVIGLSNKLLVVDSSINQNANVISRLDTSLKGILSRESDFALKSKDVSRLDEKIDMVLNNLFEIKDSSTTKNIFADDVVLGYDSGGTRLSANKMTGRMYVYASMSDDTFGEIHTGDVKVYTGGAISGEAHSLMDTIDNLNETTSNLTNLREEYDETNKLVTQVIQDDGSGTISVIANNVEARNGELRGDIVIANSFHVPTTVDSASGLSGFEAVNADAPNQLVGGHFANIWLYADINTSTLSSATGGVARGGDSINVFKYLYEHNESINILNSWMSALDTYMKVETDADGSGTGSIRINGTEAGFNIVKAIGYWFRGETEDTDVRFSIYGNDKVVLKKDDFSFGDLVCNDIILQENSEDKDSMSLREELGKTNKLLTYLSYDSSNHIISTKSNSPETLPADLFVGKVRLLGSSSESYVELDGNNSQIKLSKSNGDAVNMSGVADLSVNSISHVSKIEFNDSSSYIDMKTGKIANVTDINFADADFGSLKNKIDSMETRLTNIENQLRELNQSLAMFANSTANASVMSAATFDVATATNAVADAVKNSSSN